MKVSYIENFIEDPHYNLALEEILFHQAAASGEGFVMLWRNAPVVVIGRFQSTAGEVNVSYVQQHNIPVVRRITGGGAVFHDRGNMNYSIIMPTHDTENFQFRGFAQPLVEYLESLGVEAETTGRNDVAVKGAKFSGSAQHISTGVMLHHGTLMFSCCLDELTAALHVDPEKYQSKGAQSVRSRVTNIAPLLPQPMSFESFRDGLARFLMKPYADGVFRSPTDEEHRFAIELANKRYRTWNWNWGSSPEFTVRFKCRFPQGGSVETLLNVVDGIVRGCHFQGDYFSVVGPAAAEQALIGLPYPFSGLRQVLSDKLLKETFNGIDPEAFRLFLSC